MARITKGILGGGRGKVANVVMGSWKGIDYIRAYAIPSNPRTGPQLTRRQILTQASRIASELNKFFGLLPDELPKLSNYNILVRRLIRGENFITAGQGFGTRNDIPTTGNFQNPSFVVISGSFVTGDRIILGMFGVNDDADLVLGRGRVFQNTIASGNAAASNFNTGWTFDDEVTQLLAIWTVIRGGQANVVSFYRSF
jgi:hypothetical protein